MGFGPVCWLDNRLCDLLVVDIVNVWVVGVVLHRMKDGIDMVGWDSDLLLVVVAVVVADVVVVEVVDILLDHVQLVEVEDNNDLHIFVLNS